MKYERALNYRREFLIERPNLEDQVDELIQLMFDEIDEGGSVENEIDHFIAACDDLLINE